MWTRTIHQLFRVVALSALSAGALAQNLPQSHADKPASPAIAALQPVAQANRVGTGGVGGMVQLKGHVPGWVTPARRVAKTVDAKQAILLRVILRRDPAVQAALKQFLDDQQTPGSPLYHQWLEPQQIGELFGVTPSDVAAVTEWLTSQGLTVKSVSPSRTIVDVIGTTAKVGAAFSTSFGYFTYDGEPHMAPMAEPSIPGALMPVIQSIHGLVDVQPKSLHHSQPMAAHPNYTDGSGGHSLLPADFNAIYGVNALLAGGNTGATIGSKPLHVAIIARSDVNPFNLISFEEDNGLPTVNWGQIYPDNTDPPQGGDDEGEAELDFDRVQGTAPGVIPDFIVNANLYTSIAYEINTLKDPILSISFGSCESGDGQSGVDVADQLFTSAAAEGISVFVSSGDSGAAGCDAHGQAPPTTTQTLSINTLCASTYVTCVGGTEFVDEATPTQYWSTTNGAYAESALSYIPEGAWNDTVQTNGQGQTFYTIAASGGGPSAFITKPSWQVGTGVPADGQRDTPDVSFSASGHDGYAICEAPDSSDQGCYNLSISNYGWSNVSGTSAAAPSMAGIAALLVSAAGEKQGNLNPLLYRLAATTPSIFHDVTAASSGVANCDVNTPSLCNNSVPGATSIASGLAGYTVNAGYDLVTGWGSLNATTFVKVATAPPSVTSVTVTTPAGVALGSSSTLTATVATPNTISTPTGAVQFYVNGTAFGPLVLLNNNVATATFTPSQTGTYAITATYSGDPSFQSSTSPAVSVQVLSGAVFTSPVLTGTTQTFSIGGAPQEPTFSLYYQILDQYITGPDARFFEPGYLCTNVFYADGCSTTVTFFPAIVPANGALMSATLVIDFTVCEIRIVIDGGVKPHDTTPSCATTSQAQAQVGLLGVVTGSLPAVGAQVQFYPPAVVPLAAAPANTYSVGVDKSGNVFAGTVANIFEYSGGSFSVVAGTGTAGYTGDGPALSSKVNYVTALLPGPQGNVLFSDLGNEEVRSLSGGGIQTYAGAYYNVNTAGCSFTKGGGFIGEDFGGECYLLYPQGPGDGAPAAANGPYVTFSGPYGLATDGANVFISDPGSNTVEMVTQAGSIMTYAGYAQCGYTQFGAPQEPNGGTICVLWSGDEGDGDIAAGGSIDSSGELANPRSLAVDPYANLFIGSGVLRMVSPGNIISTPKLAGNTLPSGPMGFDHAGDLFIGQYVENSQGQYLPEIDKITFDSNANPTSMTTWANTGVNALTVGNHGELITYDGTNINVVGAAGQLTFQNVDTGQTSTPQEATITNTGDQNLLITSATGISGPNAADFKVSSDTCTGSVVAPGASCVLSVTFKPTTGSTETASVNIASNAGSGAQTLLLTGVAATAPTIAIQSQPASAADGVALTAPIVATAIGGSPPYTFTSSLNSTNGKWTLIPNGANVSITGTPHVAGGYSFTITATDGFGLQGTVTGILAVAPITIPAFYQPAAQLGYPYALNGNVPVGGIPPYSYSLSFPAGSGQWAIAPTSTGFTVTGIPTVVGSFPYTITATDSFGASSTYSGTMAVAQGVALPTIVAVEAESVSGTTVTYSGSMLLGGASTFSPGQALPTGTVQFALDNIPFATVSVTGGVTASANLTTDVLHHALTMTGYSGDSNYTSFTSYASSEFDINGNRAQTITFMGLSAPAGSTIALTAHASSGLPVTYQVISGDAMLDGSGMNLIFGSSVGQVVVQAMQGGDSINFAAAPNVTATFTTY